ncbi:MAG TPA: hypothetical protein VEY33_12445 [Gemmatimonadota bacterium]|nr:hypothetical protein [Gemmatimonadota bacterium]
MAFTWHPGRPVDTRQDVEIIFHPPGKATRVDLVHSGWEHLGKEGAGMRAGYDTGWDFVLSLYSF